MTTFSTRMRNAIVHGSLAALLITQSAPGALGIALSDTPLAVKNRAAPNIIYVLDDSGSMNSEFLPALAPTNDGALWWNTNRQSFVGLNKEDAVEAGVVNYNRNGDATALWKKYMYLFPVGVGSSVGLRTYADGDHDHFAVPPTADYAWTRSHVYNALYYNPAVTYTPWEPAHDGTTAITFADADPTAAKTHPRLGSTTVNLTANLDSNRDNWTFRLWPGMRAPAAASYRKSGSDRWLNLAAAAAVPADDGYWDVRIAYYPATYYVADANGAYAGPDGQRLRRVEIRPDNTFPSGRSYADEIKNYANWFVYYRKRQLMVNAAIGASMRGLTEIRGGMFSFNDRAAVTMYDFGRASGAQNGKRLLYDFYQKQFTGGTPTRDALDWAGQQFSRTNTGAPVQHACQFNIAFVITDGFANNTSGVSLNPGNYDGQTDYATYPYNLQFSTNGATLTHPYQDSYSNTLSDIAMKYYATRLRGTLPAGKVPVDAFDTRPNADRNRNLHMNTYALGLGVKGTIFGTGTAAATAPFTNPPAWPDPSAHARSPAAVDDLWHATLNGRGDMLSASDPVATNNAMRRILNTVVGKVGAATAVAVTNARVTAGERTVYLTSYNSGNWSGDLNAYLIDDTTGIPDLNNPQWTTSARTQLDARTADDRNIITASGAAVTPGVQFQPTTARTATRLSAAQQSALNSAGATDGAAVLAFVRGERRGEGSTYRTRAHLLGDIVNAEPVVVKKPSAGYRDAGYAAFKTSQASRNTMVFQGANDGMLHAFNAATGAEAWAFIPSFVLPTLNMLSLKDGFAHQYYVDGTPAVADVDFNRTNGASGSGDWHTLLVGGLGKGGKGYYALDVTDPLPASKAAATDKVLWEFPNAGNRDTRVAAAETAPTYGEAVGYSFGKPVIVKTAAKGWVVLVTSGYNNGGDGKGYLFVLDAKTGAVIKAIGTGAGSLVNPSGLAHINAYVENAHLDRTTDFVYGGDLLGNVWRFDLSGASADNWSVTRLATLVDERGTAQPITTVPQLAKLSAAGGPKRMVYIGTGQYLGDDDIPGSANANATATQTQTMYGLVDDMSRMPLIEPLRSALQQQEFGQVTTAAGMTTRTISARAVNLNVTDGWYLDLSLTGERAVTNAAVANGMLSFTTNVPSADPCVTGESWLTVVDFATGGRIAVPGVTYASKQLGDSLASRVLVIQLPDGRYKAVVRLYDGRTRIEDLPHDPPPPVTRRISWRELVER